LHAQFIGEPGTISYTRTFHVGGTASSSLEADFSANKAKFVGKVDSKIFRVVFMMTVKKNTNV